MSALKTLSRRQWIYLSILLAFLGIGAMVTKRISGSKGPSPATEGTPAVVLGAILLALAIVAYVVKVWLPDRKQGMSNHKSD